MREALAVFSDCSSSWQLHIYEMILEKLQFLQHKNFSSVLLLFLCSFTSYILSTYYVVFIVSLYVAHNKFLLQKAEVNQCS
jgi:hypothetical protein